MKHVNIYLQSNRKYRIFSTAQFTIRDLIVQISRYNPSVEAIAIWYSESPLELNANNEKWKSLSEEELLADVEQINESGNRIELLHSNDKSSYLKRYDYRTALNVYFVYCLETGTYPIKNPFDGVKISGKMPRNISSRIAINHFPAFLKDDENPFYYFSDILLYYDGRRVERTWRGEPIKGYLLTCSRFDNNELNQIHND